MNVSQFFKFSTNCSLLFVSFLLLQVTNISAWKGSASLELCWNKGVQFVGFDFLPYTMYYHAACGKGASRSEQIYTEQNLLKGEPKKHELTVTLSNGQREVSAILCAQVGDDLYYLGQGPVENSISVYKGSAGSNEVKCYGFIENFKFTQ